LGIATALGPIGGWLATTGSFDLKAILLFATVACWISGFDIIYACQDVDFDKQENLHSIPARFGVGSALFISALLHMGTAAGLIMLFFISHLSVWFGIGVAIGILILLYEHLIISENDLSRLNTAFFTMNGMISILLFIFALIGVL
jgi:4-hydroxybenzoate polyprenyltransferase